MRICHFVFCFIVIFFYSSNCIGQAGWQWGIGSQLGDIDSYPITIDKNGNIIEAGINVNDSCSFGTYLLTGFPGFIVKADSNGNFLWAIKVTDGSAYPIRVISDDAGSIYLYGKYDSPTITVGSFTLINSSYPGMYYWIKISTSGNIIWAQNISPSESNCTSMSGDIGIDRANNIYVYGIFQDPMTIGSFSLIPHYHGPGGNMIDFFLAKFDTTGTAIWAKSYGDSCLGGSSDMCVSRNGNVYVWGSFYSTTRIIGSTILYCPNPLLYAQPYMAKFDSSGNTIWAKSVNYHIEEDAITTDRNENIYITGKIDSTIVFGTDTLPYQGGYDMFIGKWDSSGNYSWAHSGGGYSNDLGYSIAVDTCGKIWISGEMGVPWSWGSTSSYTMNFDGHILYTHVDSFSDLTFIAEYDTAGNYICSMSLPSGADDNNAIVLDDQGNFYLAGDYVFYKMLFGADTLLPSSSNEQLFIAKFRYDSLGCNQYCLLTPITGDIQICKDSSSTLYNATGSGTWSSSNTSIAVIDPATGAITGVAPGAVIITYSLGSGCVVTTRVTIKACTLENMNTVSHNEITIYPNPTKNEFTINRNNPFVQEATAELYDMTGRLINAYTLTGSNTNIFIPGLAPGIYICKISGTNDMTVVKKIVVEAQ